ncbi:MAG: serine protease [Ruegeria sp.]
MAGDEKLTANDLQPLLQDRPELVNDTIEEVFQSAGHGGDIDSFRSVAQLFPEGNALAGLMVERLLDKGLMARFIAALRMRGVEPLPPDPDQLTDPVALVPLNGAADHDDLDIDQIGEFASGAKAFRCRVMVDEQVMGSGAMVSPRLILTSAHVVDAYAPDAATGVDPSAVQDVSVQLSDGSRHQARAVWVAPCFEGEKTGQMPEGPDASALCDAALLRIRAPLGRTLGHLSLPAEPPDWVGTEAFVLIHFPEGAEKGIAVGHLRREQLDEARHVHSISTHGGSSGGAGFDRSFAFVGLHQGRWRNVRRLVPYHHFAANDDFRTQIDRDCPPRRLWSLSDDLDGHFVIGRNGFFDALTAMLETEETSLRGIWIKRTEIDGRQGMNFSFNLLDRFLDVNEGNHRVVRLETGFNRRDLVDAVRQRALLGAGPVAARAGVAADETTDAAHEDDRIKALIEELRAQCQARNEMLWLYFENPESGQIDHTRFQLEHLIEEVLEAPEMRLVLSGCETYDLRARTVTSIDEAATDTRPAVFVDYIRPFLRRDVFDCVQLMTEALELDWDEGVCNHMVDRALDGIPPVVANRFATTKLPLVADRLRSEARRDLGEDLNAGGAHEG